MCKINQNIDKEISEIVIIVTGTNVINILKALLDIWLIDLKPSLNFYNFLTATSLTYGRTTMI